MAQELKFSQGQRLTQKLSPSYLLTQKLIGMQINELEQAIKKELEENPTLEIEDSDNITARYSPLKTYADNDPYTEYLISKNLNYNESLFDQLHNEELNDEEIVIGEEIIGNLDKDGYLRRTDDELIESIRKKYNFTPKPEHIEKVRKIVMHLDPAGMASRNLKECLTAQLEESEEDDHIKEKSIELIRNHFEDFTNRRYEKIIQKLNLNPETLNKIIEIIHRLDPHPGFSSESSDYIFPDFIIEEEDGKLKVESLGEFAKLKINPDYLNLLDSEDIDSESKSFIKQKIDDAAGFISALNSRNENLRRIIDYILNKQKKFFQTSGDVLEPMFEKDVARELGMELSTVSRAVNRKYIQTPFGIFELRSFFSYPVRNESGEEISNEQIKKNIKEIIDNEDKSKPVTDEQIAKILKGTGFPVARRTVAKYREAMKIPKATLRRKIRL
ncbi:MAG: RNA polymerase factor sigma-54 [Ignavibacteria bacterium]|nr:RNA polymerase factor sigma-54 [Ignavibacteria bacterium]